jgi:hypothetical protein
LTDKRSPRQIIAVETNVDPVTAAMTSPDRWSAESEIQMIEEADAEPGRREAESFVTRMKQFENKPD